MTRRIQPTLTGDVPRVTWLGGKTGRQLVLFNALHEAAAEAEETERAYTELVAAAGHVDRSAKAGESR